MVDGHGCPAECFDYDIERRRHERFVGRAELLAQLDRLLIADGPDRWVAVTGGPGILCVAREALTLDELARVVGWSDEA